MSVRGLSKSYAGVPAAQSVDLELRAGTIVGLVGKNGAGKSTVIKCLAGLVSPDAGSVLIDGAAVDVFSPQAAAAAGLAFVHQELALVGMLSVTENVLMGVGLPSRRWGAVDWPKAHESVRVVLTQLGVRVDPHTLVSRLSVAEQRMVMIARGVIQNARLLVLDEPTASLTNSEIEVLFEVLRGMRDRGVCIVYVSHRLAEITSLTEQVVVMRNGEVIADLPTSEVDRGRLIELIAGHSEAAEMRRTRPAGLARGATLLAAEHLSDGEMVQDVTLEVAAGEVVGLAGLVGSGRTELAHLLAGISRPVAGTIEVGWTVARFRGPYDAISAGIVLLPEDRRGQGNIQSQSIRENISLPALPSFRRSRRLAVPSVQQEKVTAGRLARELSIKIPSVASDVATLSGGNQQKVVLAKWLNRGADVFIFDEPTHGIDVDGKSDVYQRMAALADAGKGVVFISSEFEELVTHCDRIVVLREGRIVGAVTGGQITEQGLLDLCFGRETTA